MIDLLERDLREKRYRFSAVREVEIPKPKGGTRPLGIPTIRDRIVQTAVKLVIEPIFEADFHECSYGYRPRRGAWMATDAIRNDLYNRAWGVVEIDLKSYFTSIVHWKLMRLIAKRICDQNMLRLIRTILKVPVKAQGRLRKTKRGVPQGSPLSPLLSNIYLNVVDQLWHSRGYPEKLGAALHRYADDMVLVCRRSEKVALGAFVALAKKLDVTVNQEKTKSTHIKEGFDFLGFEFVKRKSPTHGKSVVYLFPSKSSQKEIRSRIRKKTARKAPVLPKIFLDQVNRMVRGWAEYYRYTNGAKAMRRLQEFINHRARRYLHYRRKGRGSGFKQIPKEKLYQMGLIQIHSGWVRPEGFTAHVIR
jgi:group II intron reverse transcriptase/maturase